LRELGTSGGRKEVKPAPRVSLLGVRDRGGLIGPPLVQPTTRMNDAMLLKVWKKKTRGKRKKKGRHEENAPIFFP